MLLLLQHHRSACQVPLYHCFGMVGGSLAMSVFGNCIIFPCAGYDPGLTLKALEEEKQVPFVQLLYGIQFSQKFSTKQG